jgi:hypothetical protein
MVLNGSYQLSIGSIQIQLTRSVKLFFMQYTVMHNNCAVHPILQRKAERRALAMIRGGLLNEQKALPRA